MTTQDKIAALAKELGDNKNFEDQMSASILFALTGALMNPRHLFELGESVSKCSLKFLKEIQDFKNIQNN